MPHLSHFLLSSSFIPSLLSEEKETALEEILELLKEDHRLSNWQELHDLILTRSALPVSSDKQASIVLYHCRTNSTEDLIIAAGRSTRGILFEEGGDPIYLIFVIAIPHALNNDYLRIIGSIARICNDPATLQKLLTTPSSEEFIEILSEKNRS